MLKLKLDNQLIGQYIKRASGISYRKNLFLTIINVNQVLYEFLKNFLNSFFKIYLIENDEDNLILAKKATIQ